MFDLTCLYLKNNAFSYPTFQGHLETISTLDIVELQRAILGISDSFSNNTAWVFIAEDYSFPVPNNPWWEAFPTTLDFSISQYGKPGNFIAVKVGDLNGTAPNLE